MNSVLILDTLPDKKIKSIGNRCLIPIRRNTNVIDYHIQTAKLIFNKPEIIVICGFESKKIKKYIYNRYDNIKYIEYDINEFTNIGTCLQIGIDHISDNSNCLIWNTNHILHKNAINDIKTNIHLKNSFVLYNKARSDIGMIINNNKVVNCYYDLPNHLYDVLYIKTEDLNKLDKSSTMNRLFLFEAINRLISNEVEMRPIHINQKYITIINSMQNINKVKRQLCSI